MREGTRNIAVMMACRQTLRQAKTLRQLVRSLDPTDELLILLQAIEPLKQHINFISTASTTNEKAGRLLTVLIKMKSKVFARIVPEFLDILRNVGQDHVANALTEESGQQPMYQRNLDLLHKHAGKLQRFIDPFGGLLTELSRTGVFRDNDCQRVNRWKTNDRLAVEEVLSIIERKSDSAFAAFIEALKATNQRHVVHVLTDGADGQPPLSDADSNALVRNRFDLIETIEPEHSGLLDLMEAIGGISTTDHQRALQRGSTVADINTAILDILLRKSQQTFDKFLEALTKTGQEHLSKLIRSEPRLGPTVCLDVHVNKADDESEMAVVTKLIDSKSTIADLLGIDACNVEISNKCIELRFINVSLESLGKLQHLLKSRSLEDELNGICEPVLTQFRLGRLTLHATADLDLLRHDVSSVTIMTHSRRQALRSAEVIDQINVSDKLLRRLSTCGRLNDAIAAAETNERKVELLLSSTSRRPDSAFDELIDALIATNQRTAANTLKAAATHSGGEQNNENYHAEDTIIDEGGTGSDTSCTSSSPVNLIAADGNYLIIRYSL